MGFGFFFLGCFAGVVCRSAADVYYVSQGTNIPAGSFATWANAASNIQDAVDAAVSGGTIFVGDGVYTADASRVVSISGKSLSIIGNTNHPERVVIDGQEARRGIHVTFAEGQSLALSGLTISNCYYAGQGAGVYLSNSILEGEALFEQCRFVDNSATGSGGGVLSVSADGSSFGIVFRDCLFEGNEVAGTSSGGAAYIGRNHILFEDCVFRGNLAGQGGGALYFYRENDSRFIRCDFIENTCGINASTGGGAVYAYSGEAGFTDCNFISNTVVQGRGGALYIRMSIGATNCVFWGNRAVENESAGGAVFAIDGKRVNSLFNCLFVENFADKPEEGKSYAFFDLIHFGSSGSTNFVENCTIVNNSGGVRSAGAGPTTMRNCIFLDNRNADGVLHNWRRTSGSYPFIVAYCYANSLPVSEYDGGGNIAGSDPGFVAPEAGDFSLSPVSVCRDAGENRDWMTRASDLAGMARLDKGIGVVDIGCYEYHSSGAIILIR